MEKSHWSKKKEKFLIKNYSNKGGIYCSEQLSIPVENIRSKAHSLGIKISNDRKSIIQQNNVNKKYEYPDISIFKNINNAETAYVMGLIWADGSIVRNTLSLEFKTIDFNDVKSTFFNLGEWAISQRKRDSRAHQTSVICHNINICNIFREYNYQNKSIESPFFINLIPEKIKHYFFRGWIDGDGCFYHKNYTNQFHISGTYDQDWSIIKSLFDNLKIKIIIKQKIQIQNNHENKCSFIRISNKNDIIKLGEYIYENFENDNIGFKRKYKKFLEIKNTFISYKK